MDEGDESLLLRRALGRTRPEDYVSWAVDRLCRDDDTPSLRILAGLSTRLDRAEIEPYFLLACHELGLADTAASSSPLETAQMIRRAYDRGHVPPAEAVEMMAQVYESSGHQQELLAPWYSLREGLAWREPYYYPLSALASVEQAVAREWSLLDRALALKLPPGWMRLTYCVQCEHVGHPRSKEPSWVVVFWSALTGRPAVSATTCERCGSTNITSLNDPEARSLYLARLHGQAN